MEQILGKQRIVIEKITPQIDGGRYPVKRVVNEWIRVEADVLIDGHDLLSARLLYKLTKSDEWQEVSMTLLNNDRWKAQFLAEEIGQYEYTIEAWVDHLATWQHEVELKVKDGQHLQVELLQGKEFYEEMALKASDEDKNALLTAASWMTDPAKYNDAIMIILSEHTTRWIKKYPQRQDAFTHPVLQVTVDRERANFSAWYSLFPRSASPEYGKHGTFKDVEGLLPRIQKMGFDVLYIPPVHPIGKTHRKGKNNNVFCEEGEPGVPYGIGSELGGHTAIHPELGTLDDLKSLIQQAKNHEMEIALDLAIQCSPDHPWVKDHPDWFKILPDGSIRYAENPPKKYQDIYPIYFETNDWKNLWLALKDVIFTWAEWGVRIIRVDNPHTKSFNFWEWVITETKAVYPDMIFLSEAFTKPKVMQQLAKLGFTQSYTYYVWRTTKQEITEYMTELVKTEMSEYFRPNFWPNTHDINPYMLQSGNENLFILRHFMAATLVSNYGIFGPSYEYMYHEANTPKEEYAYSEKYEIKWWDWKHENKLTYVISEINRIRKENTAFKATNNLTFCPISNDQLLAYLKTAKDGNRILCIANLSGNAKQEGMVQIPLSLIGKSPWESYRVHDLVTGMYYTWQGEQNFVSIDPYILPFHLFRIEDL
ncbi:MAG: alpha-1,4-glucan--maltose-1-phosphate maltosyltransferase [Spirosomataceae bacterium]